MRPHPALRFAPAITAAGAMRARFLTTPITSDEGGYLAIARTWSHGATLYRDAWVDRPQGLLVVYRLWSAIGLGSPEGVRLLALAACLLGAVSAGLVAEELFGRRAAVPASLLVAVLASLPQIEGFSANGELLSGAVGVTSLAMILRASWNRPLPSVPLLVAAGAVGGFAVSIKQSGVDAFIAGFVALIWRSRSTRWPRRERFAAPVAVILGATAVVIAMLVHGAISGWDRFWLGLLRYRLEQRSALEGAHWDRLVTTWRAVAPGLAPVMAAVLAAGVIAWWSGRRAALFIATAWFAAAAVAFVSGGQFHAHYWVIVAFPLGTIAGGLLSTVPARWSRILALTLLLVMPAKLTIDAVRIPRSDVGRILSDDPRLTKDEHIAGWFEQRAGPSDQILALCASAGLYGNLSIDVPFPFLWWDNVRFVDSAREELAALFDSPAGPTYVAEYQSADSCDPSGAANRALHANYAMTTVIDGITIWRRLPAAAR